MFHQRQSITLGLLIAFATLFSAFTLWRIGVPLQIDVNEAWNGWQVDRWLSGAPLYPEANTLIINNYPPLSFYIVGLIRPAFDNSITAGRSISMASVFAIALAIYLSARHLNAGRWAASLGALWFIATMTRFFIEYAGMNDPNLLALAVMATGFVVFIRSTSRSSLYMAFSLMMLAGLIKHNIVAIPFSALLLLWLSNRGRATEIAFYCSVTVGLLGLALFELYGAVFFQQLMMAREISLLRPLQRIGRLQFVLPVLIFWFIWLRSAPPSLAKRVTTILVLVSFVVNELALTGAGVANNAQFELVFATGLCLSIIVRDLQGRFSYIGRKRFDVGLALLWVMVARFLLWPALDPYLLVASPSYKADIAERVAILQSEIERVRAIPGPVNCSIRSACYLAGKDFVFDDFAMSQRIKTGHATEASIRAEAERLGIQFVAIREEARWHSP
ncbi:MAG: glycosyltransferase family 39 protein [Beijerinckiaceae bacterium]|nr:glycosyltransferase family 39 protein [Beijerinckiaceae bacterium]